MSLSYHLPENMAQRLPGAQAAAVEAPPTRLRLTLIGPMDAWSVTGERVLPRTRKARALLAILALEAPAATARGRLASLLWSRRGEEQARGSLRQALFELQEVLAPVGVPVLVATRDSLALRTEHAWIDAREAARLAEAQPEALSLLTRDLLADLDGLDPAFDAWLAERRRALREDALALALRLLSAARGPDQEAAAARRVLAISPAQENAWRHLIQAEASRGDRGAALAAWEECRAVFASRFGAEPSPETAALVANLRGAVIARLPVAPVRPAPQRGARLGVLPLRALGPEHDEHLSAALPEEITGALARFRWLTLVDSASVAAATQEAGSGEDINAAARGIGLDFLLSGTVQRHGSRVRVSLRLTDLRPPESVVWTQRFDRDATDMLALQDDVAAEVVARVDPEILMIEAHRAARRLVQPSAYDLLLRALPAIYRLDREGFEAAGALLSQATEIEPDHAPAHAWHAYWHLFKVGQGWGPDDRKMLEATEELASRAVALDPRDAQALTILGHSRAFLWHRIEEAIALHEQALALNPNLAMAWVFSGMALAYRGEHTEALRRFERYKRLSPLHPHAFFFDSGRLIPLLFLHRHAEVDAAARLVTSLHPSLSFPYKLWLPALGHLGLREEAATVRAKLLDIEPDFTVEKAMRRTPVRDPKDRAHYELGLRLAGLD